MFLSVLGDSGLCSSVTSLVWIILMETNNLDMEKKHRSSTIMELEEERWRLVKMGKESFGKLWVMVWSCKGEAFSGNGY